MKGQMMTYVVVIVVVLLLIYGVQQFGETTFNNATLINNTYVTAVSGNATASGGTGWIPKFHNATHIIPSLIFDRNTSIVLASTLNVTNITLSDNCADGQVLKWSGGVGLCGTDTSGSGGGNGTGNVSGSGTANFLPVFFNATHIIPSIVNQNDSMIGINISFPLERLHVNGSIKTEYVNWTRIYDGNANTTNVNTTEVLSFAEYNGKLYAGFSNTSGGGDVYVYDGAWLLSNDFGTIYNSVDALAVYNGKLYAGLSDGNNDADVYVYDGINWQLNNNFTTAYGEVKSLGVYNGKLYAGLGSGSNDADVYVYDGTTWTQDADFGLGEKIVFKLTNYNGKLYAMIGNGSATGAVVYVYDGRNWTLNNVFDPVYNEVQASAVYNGKLYAGLAAGSAVENGDIYVYDGTTWTLSVNFTDPPIDVDSIRSLAVYNGRLYAGLNGEPTTYLYVFDGNNWTLQNKIQPAENTNTIMSMFVYNGRLYAGTGENGVGEGDILVYSERLESQLSQEFTPLLSSFNEQNQHFTGNFTIMDRLGVGTSSPWQRLDVKGNINSSGLFVNSTAGFTGTCTIVGLTQFVVVGGIITSCT